MKRSVMRDSVAAGEYPGLRFAPSGLQAGLTMRTVAIITRAFSGLALAILACVPAAAQDYPTRPVTIVVPFAAGGGTDIVARLLAQKLEQRLGKSFLIDNKPGAGSTIGATAAARAAPDGYTLLMAPSPTLA